MLKKYLSQWTKNLIIDVYIFWAKHKLIFLLLFIYTLTLVSESQFLSCIKGN